MKRILAALAALMMISAVGCGKVDDDSSAAPSSETVITDGGTAANAPTDANEDGDPATDDSKTSETTADESTAPENESSEGENSVSADDAEGWLSEKNCIIIDEYQDEDNDPYDPKAICKMAELAAAQYNSIIDRDKQAYFDSVNIAGMLKSDGLAETIAADYSTDNMPEAKLSVYYLATMLALDVIQDDYTRLYDDYNDGKIDMNELKKKNAELAAAAAEKLNPDTAKELFNEYSAFERLFAEDCDDVPDGFANDPSAFRIEPSDDLVCSVELDGYTADEEGIFAELDIIFAAGDWEYILDECCVCLSGEENSVFVPDIRITENEVKGKSIDEIMEGFTKEKNLRTANAAAKTAFNAVMTFIADKDTEGVSLGELIRSGSYAKANSAEGLTIDNDISINDAEGDSRLEKDLCECGFNEGCVYVGFNGEVDLNNVFVQFKDADGNIGQYPNATLNSERAAKVSWGTYLSE